MADSVDITLSRSGKSITFPVNPEILKIGVAGSNEVVEVVGLGEVVVPRRPKLRTIPIESFYDDSSYTDFLLSAQKRKGPLRLVVTGLDFKAMRVVVQNFEYEKRAGEEEDTYFTLDLIEYVPYGAALISLGTNGTAGPTEDQRSIDSRPNTPSTYTVKSGDSLWGITQKFTGNGSRYQELYNANKTLISNQRNVIHPGNILDIPSGW